MTRRPRISPKKNRSRKPTSSATTYPDFQLHSLGWKAFQDLCLIVLDEQLGQNVQRFSPVHDGGRDGAFEGNWKPRRGPKLQGQTIVQCKFTNRPGATLTKSAFEDEFGKVRKLWESRSLDNYVLLTNYRVTADFEEKSKARFAAFGCKHFCVFGSEWISSTIQRSSRLRMLVPRLYGLGDLSQILDERWYTQTQSLLESQRENLRKFVPTWPYRMAVDALNEHGFVLLLGEPAVGKTAIAATLTLASGDAWKCRPMKLERALDLRRRWNPEDPKQLFWIDDAFGETQYESSRSHEWNSVFPWLDAALKSGSKVILTSRDYIYRHARSDLKQSAFPLLQESQVVVDVAELTPKEREQILYNHVRLGNQTQSWRRAFKEFFDIVCQHGEFRPEIARRLGSSAFTKHLSLNRISVNDFVERPEQFLKETIEGLSDDDKSALAAIFLKGGELLSPVQLKRSENEIISKLGGRSRGITYGLNAMRGSFVDVDEGSWTFKHPTIADAFASLLSENPEFIDLYISGASMGKILNEVSCGVVQLEGVKLIVPKSRFHVIISRLHRYQDAATNDFDGWWRRRECKYFLARRCSTSFLKQYAKQTPNFWNSLLNFASHLSVDPDFSVVVTLGKSNLLPQEQREIAIERVKVLAVETPDADFLTTQSIIDFFSKDEIEEIMVHVKTNLLPRLNEIVTTWEDNYSSDEDADSYYSSLVEAFEAFGDYFDEDEDARTAFSRTKSKVELLIEESSEAEKRKETDEGKYEFNEADVPPRRDEEPVVRRIFDDIDA